MSALNPIAQAILASRFIATESGGFIDAGVLYLSADGKTVELLEWSKDLGEADFEEAQTLAAQLGPEWLVASPHEWTGLFNYSKYGPATDAPGIGIDWHWTRERDASSPSGYAFYVLPRYGHVYWNYQLNRGRVRAVRRVRASQYLTLGL